MKHITYTDKFFKSVDANSLPQQVSEIRRSKVYGTFLQWFPSGQKTMIRVWNTRLNKMVVIREDIDLAEVID